LKAKVGDYQTIDSLERGETGYAKTITHTGQESTFASINRAAIKTPSKKKNHLKEQTGELVR